MPTRCGPRSDRWRFNQRGCREQAQPFKGRTFKGRSGGRTGTGSLGRTGPRKARPAQSSVARRAASPARRPGMIGHWQRARARTGSPSGRGAGLAAAAVETFSPSLLSPYFSKRLPVLLHFTSCSGGLWLGLTGRLRTLGGRPVGGWALGRFPRSPRP
jgi:hypothetical protein